MAYRNWLIALDEELFTRYGWGIFHAELDDAFTWFQSGMTPAQAAEELYPQISAQEAQ
jgi:hypothetical protein